MTDQLSFFADDDGPTPPATCPSCGQLFGSFRETIGEYHCGDPWHLTNVATLELPAVDAHQLARTTDPDTSHDAADQVVPDLRLIQARVLGIFERHGSLTQHQLIAIYRHEHGPAAESTVRTRCSELADAGLVRDTGDRVQLVSGRHAIVWQLTPADLVAAVRAERATRRTPPDEP